MQEIRKFEIWTGIILGIISNVTIGIILINQAIKGHSILGMLISGAVPIISIVAYGFYAELENTSIERNKTLLLKILKPSFIIGGIILALNLFLIFYAKITGGLTFFDMDVVIFFLLILLIFFIPNVILDYLFFLWLNRKRR